MKILLLTPQLPYPPRQGTTIRNFNLLRLLARRHTVDLFTFLAPGEALTHESPLHQLCRRMVCVEQPPRPTWRRAQETLLSPLPDMALRLASRAAASQLTALVQAAAAEGAPYHLVQAEGIEMARYGLQAVALSRTLLGRDGLAGRAPRFVFDDHNVEYLLQKRAAEVDARTPARWPAALYSQIQWRKLRRYERRLCQQADLVLAVSQQDGTLLARLSPGANVQVIPNAVDVEALARLPRAPVWPPRLLFTGKMDYRPNVDAALWFGQEVLPRIQELAQAQGLPPAHFQIVGQRPHARLQVLAARPDIEITGAVPAIEPYMQAAAVYVVPLRVGGGTRFKVLEALASATPTVSTSLGVEGLGVQHGRELLIADEPEAFAQTVVRLLQDAQAGGSLGHRLGAAGRAFVAAHYSWEQIAPKLEAALGDGVTG